MLRNVSLTSSQLEPSAEKVGSPDIALAVEIRWTTFHCVPLLD